MYIYSSYLPLNRAFKSLSKWTFGFIIFFYIHEGLLKKDSSCFFPMRQILLIYQGGKCVDTCCLLLDFSIEQCFTDGRLERNSVIWKH